MSIGDALAQARSQAGLTVAQVSQQTCIRETIIRGIERGDFSACGGDFYARGHIRSIARAVGVDPDELIREYDATYGAPHSIRAADVFEPTTPIKLRERRSPNWSVAMVIAIAVVLGYGVYRAVAATSPPAHPVASNSGRLTSPSAPATPSPSPAPTRSNTAQDTFSHVVVIHLTAIQNCWVGFTASSGQYLKQAYVVGGTSQTWRFRYAVNMKIGNPGGILLTVDGRKYSHLGSYGQPVTLTLGPGRKLPSQAAG